MDADVIRQIGGEDGCDIRIQTTYPHVAVLARRGDRLFLRDMGSGADVLVNGERLTTRGEIEVTRYDDINIDGTAVVVGADLFLGHAQIGIDTTSLRFVHAGTNGRTLCDGVFLRARPSTLTAIVGPAGCGKTVFLNLINGYKRPTEGRVLVAERHDLHTEQQQLRNYIGYVPQDDVMIPDLTVRQSLDFRLRLRFPDMTASIRDRLIHETCRQLGIPRARIDTFLDTVIGSAESGKRGLSGGERKRANIAHELLLKPVILILDEPTSGLSSVDADQMVRLLRDLATNERITIVATIHQPSRTSFACFDDILVMASGGRIAYYGPAQKAVPFMEMATETPCAHDANPAEFILSQVFNPREAERIIRHYQTQRGDQLPEPIPPNSISVATPSPTRRTSVLQKVSKAFTQAMILAGRNLKVLRADRPTLRLTVGQVPIIALLVLVAFFHHADDGASFEDFARKVYTFSAGKRPYQEQGKPIPVDSLAEEAATGSSSQTDLISRQAAQRRGAIYFVLVAAGIWFGILGGCREVVTEKHILSREYRTCVDLFPYLASKFATQVIQTGLQTALLTALVVPFLLHLSIGSALGLWAILWLVGATSSALGLTISCVAPNYRAALTAVPLLMIPQLLFGGIMRPQVDMPKGTYGPAIMSFLTIQRWGFEPALAVDPYAKAGVMVQQFPSEVGTRYASMDFIQFGDGTLLNCFFKEKPWVISVLLPLGCLAAAATVFLSGGYMFLRKELSK